MTLALLLTAVTGAWADETPLVTINASSDFISGSKTFDGVATVTFTGNIAYDDMPNYGWSAGYGTPGGSVSVEPAEGITISSCKFYFNTNETYTISTAPFVLYLTTEDSSYRIYTGPNSTGEMLYGDGIKKIEVYGAAEPPITVEPGSSANTWTFSMPGSDVVLTPIYANAAAFATTGTEPEVKTLLPEAAEGVIAGTDASLIAEGTGIVAFAGTSTVKQGTLMYAIGTSATQAPDLTAFSATVPTAKDIADDGADVYVWYYIKGADAPDGQQATEDNTFNDTEPACLTVTVLTNKFDIQFNAANANTIEAGKATVTVGGTAATVTEGKLQGVKMGTEVKLKANTGYKFRKVEVKKKEETPAVQARTWNFTQWSEATVNNIKADAAASKIEGWSDIEKEKDAKDGKSAGETEDKCFWYQGEVNSDGTLSANGSVIEELKGLKFNEEYASRRDLAIAVDYSSTSLGDYAGGAYLMLGGGKVQSPDKRICCFTIPNVKIGQKITVVVESHKPSTGRGISLFVNSVKDDGNKIGDSFMPTTKESYTWENWTLPDGITADGDTVDILVYNNDVCHIYSITVE